MNRIPKIIARGAFLSLAIAGVVVASHSWGSYHWARTSNPFTLKLGDNVSGVWDSHLGITSADWSLSSVLDTTIVAGSTDPRKCRPSSGRVQVCNAKYGNNGWLGIAQIWITGGEHISQGVVKLNDTYFNTTKYNTPAWRNLVMCQEVGHTFGLDHQDEDFANPPLGTCMDYSSDPTLNQHPNAHDYEQLELMYAHLDSITTLSQPVDPGPGHADLPDAAAWGQSKRFGPHGQPSLYEKDLGGGKKVFTFVFWTE